MLPTSILQPSQSVRDGLCATACRIMASLRAISGHEPQDITEYGRHAYYNLVADAADWTLYAISPQDPPIYLFAISSTATGAEFVTMTPDGVSDDLLCRCTQDLLRMEAVFRPMEVVA
jgi:hypothetical protein